MTHLTGRGGQVVLGAISNSSRENALGSRFEYLLGNTLLNRILHQRIYGNQPKLLPVRSTAGPNLGRGTQLTKPSNQSGYKPRIKSPP